MRDSAVEATRTVQEQLEIRLLGPFEVIAGARPADVGGSKRQALLAILALRSGRVVSVDMLVDGLWGADLPSAPRNALHHHVARLRAALGDAAIAGSADGYALRGALVDAIQFEELLAAARSALRDDDAVSAADAVESALALWHGSALQGLPETPWLTAEARRLETLRVDALEEQFEVALALGEHRQLVPPLRTALADNPYRERLWGQLMIALYRSGRQADALEAFQEARRILADELGLAPGPDLRRLQEAILSHDPAIAAVAADVRRRGNLPAPSTSFVGREEEVREVARLLREHRLVTLTGPPGVGKSRLAVETARSLAHEFPGGIWLVDFARAGVAEDAVRLLAHAVDARGPEPLARAASRLRRAHALLLLDACEHVLAEAARIASALLAECSEVRILATSREAIHATGEGRFPVRPLEAAAVELFLERARAARPGFVPDDEAVSAVGEIVRRVDGLPLAIELAAARANVLGLAEIVSILDRRSSLLRDSPSSDPGRIALRELVEWSYDLLHGDEKTLLQQLAVHRGGASLASLAAAAQAHGLNESTVAYLVSALVDKSTVSVSFSGGAARYDMLDTVREYVLDRLVESGRLAAVRKAHAEHFATLADSAHAGLRGSEWLEWVKRLDVEHDNLWAALDYARGASDAVLGARLAVGLGWYFGLAGRVSEGRAFVESALGPGSDVAVPLRIELLGYVCYLATEEHDLEPAIEAGERGVALAEANDAPWETALVKLALAFAYDRVGPTERAAVLAEEARRAFDQLGDAWGAAHSALTGALGALGRGDFATAGALAAEAARLSEGYDACAIPAALVQGSVAERLGQAEASVDAYGRAFERSERAGFADHGAFALSGLGSSRLAAGDLRQAEELQRQALGTAEAAEATWVVAHVRVQLARIAATAGDAPAAERLYRQVLEWSRTERPHHARESLFLALAGSPAAAAEDGLAALADKTALIQ